MPTRPRIFRVRQTFPRPRVEDVPGEVHRQLKGLQLEAKIRPGQSVAMTAGSRGIANIHLITRAAVEHLLGLGAEPFIIPAMGSHGGGTPDGQRKVLEDYGITEAFCGCPIRSSMETEIVCHAKEGFPVHFDRLAFQADHVLVCGRVKPHTNFSGPIESGLMKMMLIGLGKHAGAKIYHAAIQDYTFDQIVRSVAERVLAECRIVAGLAIVENGYDETAAIEGVAAERFVERETELLKLAKQWMPKLPFDRVDVLLIDEMGKNISGSGMDTNVIGRKRVAAALGEGGQPSVKRIAVRSLTPESHGNATGIGIADFCSERLAGQVHLKNSWINAITAGHPAAVKMPPALGCDREIVDSALLTIGLTPPERARILWIRNTLCLEEVECSEPYLEEARDREDLDVLTEPRDFPYDPGGDLPESMGALAAKPK